MTSIRAALVALLALVLLVPTALGAFQPAPEDAVAILWEDFCTRKPEHQKCQIPTPSPTPTPTPSPTPSPSPTPTPSPTPIPSPSPTPSPTPPPTPTPSPTLSPTLPPTPSPSASPACGSNLQTRIDGTPSGGTLDIRGCSFSGSVTVTKPLTLIGGSLNGRLLVRNTSDVVIDGLNVTGGAGTALQQGVIDADNSNRVTLRDVFVHDALGSCVSFTGGTGHLVVDSELARCQQQGFHATSTTGAVFRGNDIHHNNHATAPGPRVDAGWEAGGGKMTVSSGAVFEANHSHDNGGPGLWCDIDCLNVEYVRNRVHHNTIGIFYEISSGGNIHDNIVYNNGGNGTTWCYDTGILSGSSKNTTIRDNVVAWNSRGIAFIAQNRGGAWNDTSGNRAINNVVIDADGIRLMNWCASPGFTTNLFTSGNTGTGGRYWSPVAEPKWERFEWQSPKSTLAEFNATPGEEGGTYLTTFEKDAILTANGIPLQP